MSATAARWEGPADEKQCICWIDKEGAYPIAEMGASSCNCELFERQEGSGSSLISEKITLSWNLLALFQPISSGQVLQVPGRGGYVPEATTGAAGDWTGHLIFLALITAPPAPRFLKQVQLGEQDGPDRDQTRTKTFYNRGNNAQAVAGRTKTALV